MVTTWRDNHPCDRFESRFRRLAFGSVIAILILASVATFSVASLGGNRSLALGLALGFGLISASFVVATLLVTESRFPRAIRFDSAEMMWRTRGGKVYTFPY